MIDPALGAALIAAVPATLASLAAWKRSKATHSIVQGNGHGTVTEMVEGVVAWIDAHSLTHKVIDERLATLHGRCSHCSSQHT